MQVYKCTLCNETFSSKKTMESHIRSHDDNEFDNSNGGGGNPTPAPTLPLPPPHTLPPPPTLPPLPTAQSHMMDDDITILEEKLAATAAAAGYFDLASSTASSSPPRAGSSSGASADSGFGGHDDLDSDGSHNSGSPAPADSHFPQYTRYPQSAPHSYPQDAAGMYRANIACIPIEKLKQQLHLETSPVPAPAPAPLPPTWHDQDVYPNDMMMIKQEQTEAYDLSISPKQEPMTAPPSRPMLLLPHPALLRKMEEEDRFSSASSSSPEVHTSSPPLSKPGYQVPLPPRKRKYLGV